MKASWAASESTIESSDQLDAVVSSIRRSGHPTMLFLEADDGSALVVGVGHSESVLTFVEPDGVTSFHSVGDVERRGHLLFLCREDVDEFLCEMAIPKQTALAAAVQFLETSTRPTLVSWEADW